MSLNFIWRNDKWYNKRVLIWRFTLVLIKINYGQIGDQTGLFYTTNPVFNTSGNIFVRRTGTFQNLRFFHLFHRTTVIQDLLVRRQFSLVPDNRTNINVEAWVAWNQDNMPEWSKRESRSRDIFRLSVVLGFYHCHTKYIWEVHILAPCNLNFEFLVFSIYIW